MITAAGPWINNNDIKYVIDALTNGWYGPETYKYCELFQKEFASYHGRKYGLMTPNCTTAIHLLLSALDIKSGDEVLVPECTWIASASSIKLVGAKTIFCDIEKDTWCIDPVSVLKNITNNTKAIIAVNIYGNMCNMNKLQDICKENNLYLIEDAAESLGSKYYNIRSGKFGIGSVFSFHRTKTITTGEGGMLLIDDDSLYERCSFLRDHGRDKNKMYYNLEVSYKYMPSNVQAALGYGQFKRIEELLERKRHHLNFYKEYFKNTPYLQFNYEDSNIINGCWITGMVIGKEYKLTKNEFINSIPDIPLRPFFYPLSSLPAYNESIYQQRNPVAYDICNRGINLPGALNLEDSELLLICNKVKERLR